MCAAGDTHMNNTIANLAIFGLSAASITFMLFVLVNVTSEIRSRKRRRQL
jgi:hypothetical protein